MLRDWLQIALNHAGLSQAEAARQLTARLRRSVDRAAVNKMVKGTREISADELLVLEEITGYPAPHPGADQPPAYPLHLAQIADQLQQLSDSDLQMVAALVERLAARRSERPTPGRDGAET